MRGIAHRLFWHQLTQVVLRLDNNRDTRGPECGPFIQSTDTRRIDLRNGMLLTITACTIKLFLVPNITPTPASILMTFGPTMCWQTSKRGVFRKATAENPKPTWSQLPRVTSHGDAKISVFRYRKAQPLNNCRILNPSRVCFSLRGRAS